MKFGKIKDDIAGKTKTTDKDATRSLPQSREITIEEYLKIRPKDTIGRKIKIIYKENEVKELSPDIALFLVSKYPSMIIIDEKQKEIVKDDILDTFIGKELRSMFAYMKHRYTGKKMEVQELSGSNEEIKLRIRKISNEIELPVQIMVEEYKNSRGK